MKKLLILFILIFPMSGFSQQATSEWKVRYIAGPLQGRNGTANDRLAVNSDSIVLKSVKNVQLIQILPASVLQIQYSENIYSRARQVPVIKQPQDQAGMMYDIMVWLPAAMILGPFKAKDHILKLLWEQDGARQEMILQIDKNDYEAVLNSLKSVVPNKVKTPPPIPAKDADPDKRP